MRNAAPQSNARQNSLLLPIIWLLGILVLLGLLPQASLEQSRARQAAASGSYLDAARHAARAAVRLPWRPDLWEMAGSYAMQAGEPQYALAYLERGQSVSGPAQSGLSPNGLLMLGDAYSQAGYPEKARRLWQELFSSAPSVEVGLRLLQAQLAQDDFPGAIATLQRLVSLQPEQAQWHYRLGLLTATRRPEEALPYLERAAELDASLVPAAEKLRSSVFSGRLSDDPAYALLLVGRTLATLDEWSLAREGFHQAALARPDYAEAWAYLGEALQHPGSGPYSVSTASGSLAALQTALRLDPHSISANLFTAIYWMRQNRFLLARQHLDVAIQQDPNNPILQVELGNLLALSGDLAAAQQALQEAASLAPLDPQYLVRLAEFSLQYNYLVPQVALPAARRAVILAPQDPASLVVMAKVLIKQGDLVSAGRFLRRALEIAPRHAPAHLQLGFLRILQGDLPSAYTELQQVLSLAPESPAADQARRLIATYIGGTRAP